MLLRCDRFGGGIRKAGSNLQQAENIIDGDLSTGWAPNPDDDPSEWFIEVNLGRAISAHSVTLVFDTEAEPLSSLTIALYG